MYQILEVTANKLDTLTGLHDRSILSSLTDKFAEREYPWSLIIVDIDHFKLVNDIYGHLVGDEVISHVAHILKVNLKKKDFPLRYGGDEFVAILPNTYGSGALALAQRLLFELESTELPVGLKVSASLGVTQSTSLDENLSDLIAKADQALYYAKETGRGRFVLANDLEIRQDMEPDFSQMVGRREELQLLQELLDNSINQLTNVCLLTGYLGTGKTKLVNEFKNYCQFKKASMYTAEVEQKNEEDNFLILTILAQAIKSLESTDIETLIESVGAVERKTIEQLSPYPFKELDRSITASKFDEEARNRRDLGKILQNISYINPYVIVLDNLTDASKSCIEFTFNVLNTLTNANILCIAISNRQQIFQSIPQFSSKLHVSKLHLEPLSPTDIRTMVFFALKTPGIPEKIVEFLVDQSGGNALYLRELITWCINAKHLSIGKGDICIWNPPAEHELSLNLISIVEGMLGNYSTDEKRVLKKAAIAGDKFTLELLSDLTTIDVYSLAEILDRFVEKKLLKDNKDHFTFSYGVMRSALISKISPSLRSMIHEKIAEFFVKKLPQSTDEDSLINEIAYHFCNSSNSIEAVNHSRKAAQRAFSKGNHSDAIYWYKELLRLSAETEQTVNKVFTAHLNIGILFSITGEAELGEKHMLTALKLTDDPVDLCGVYYRLGDNYHRRSLYPKATKFFAKTLSIGYSISSRSCNLIGNIVGALLGLSFIYRIQGKPQIAKDQLVEARKLLDSEEGNYEPELDGMYYTRLADIEAETGSPEAVLKIYEKGLDIFVQCKDLTGEAVILNNMHDLYAQKGDYDSMLNSLKQVIKLNTAIDDQLGLAIGFYNLAETYLHLNMLDLAKRYFQMYIELSGRIENQLGMAYGQLGLGNLSMLDHQYEKAVEHFTNSSNIFMELSCTDMKLDADLSIVKALLQMGNYRDCNEILFSASSESSNPHYLNTALHLKGVLLFNSANGNKNLLKESISILENSISKAEQLSSDEIVYMYGNLFRALQSDESTREKRIKVLQEGNKLLESHFSIITSESFRNSILSRADIMSYLNLCKREGLTETLLDHVVSVIPKTNNYNFPGGNS